MAQDAATTAPLATTRPAVQREVLTLADGRRLTLYSTPGSQQRSEVRAKAPDGAG